MKDDKYDAVMIDTAKIWAKQSKCNRLKVGAVLALEGRVIMCGYNGTVTGTDNCCEEPSHEGSEFLVTKASVLHAEKNVILFCAKKGISVEGATLYVTHNPCSQCAADLAQSGIKRVVFAEFYRDRKGIEDLTYYGIEVVQYLQKQPHI